MKANGRGVHPHSLTYPLPPPPHTHTRTRTYTQQTGMHAMRKLEDGELDIAGTGSPPWAMGVARDMAMKAFYYIQG